MINAISRTKILVVTLAALMAVQLSACVTVIEQPGSSSRTTPAYDNRRAVPQIEGMTLGQAEAKLQRAGFRLGTVTREADRRAPGGTILWQDPEPHVSMARGGAVDVVVAKAYARVPHLRGLSLKHARRAIRDAGFVLGEVRERPDRRAADRSVIRQHPKPRTLAEQGHIVDIVIAQGPRAQKPHGTKPQAQKPRNSKPQADKPAAESTIGEILANQERRVPRLRGLSLHQAEMVLHDAGLELGTVTRKTTGKHPRGTVIAQHPKPKAKVAPGTLITLELAKAPKKKKPQNANDLPLQLEAARPDDTAQEATAVEVPRLHGLSSGAAIKALRAAGLELGKISHTRQGEGDNDTVISQRPRPFEQVVPGTRVNLVVKEPRD